MNKIKNINIYLSIIKRYKYLFSKKILNFDNILKNKI